VFRRVQRVDLVVWVSLSVQQDSFQIASLKVARFDRVTHRRVPIEEMFPFETLITLGVPERHLQGSQRLTVVG